jgi:hypothetical protein
MRKSLLALAVLTLTAAPLSAQRLENWGLEFRPFAGMYVPLTSHRYDFKDAPTFGAQAAYELGDNFHVVGTFGWTDVQTKIGLSRNNVYLYTYDVGAEGNLLYEVGQGWLWRPFVGMGGGGRTYNYEGSVASRTCTAGYAAIGTEVQKSVVAYRIEARDYLNCFESPMTGKKKTRNDAMFTFGIALHLR